eukprot:TRINITY_DN73101_c0_g1_i1.p1 TRINITY_DN73101_c0_g1~~TRINITY_DN73101_c0_g1_i1.p1  ORF type:complete len:187 (+),score=28.76 TRINITY_DN73101_c0_g1_i1:75-635(+)
MRFLVMAFAAAFVILDLGAGREVRVQQAQGRHLGPSPLRSSSAGESPGVQAVQDEVPTDTRHRVSHALSLMEVKLRAVGGMATRRIGAKLKAAGVMDIIVILVLVFLVGFMLLLHHNHNNLSATLQELRHPQQAAMDVRAEVYDIYRGGSATMPPHMQPPNPAHAQYPRPTPMPPPAHQKTTFGCC